MKFKKEYLQDIIGEKEVISSEIVETGRWHVLYYEVFKFEDKFYETSYRVGATEEQDEIPYEFEPDEIECNEVVEEKYEAVRYVKVKSPLPELEESMPDVNVEGPPFDLVANHTIAKTVSDYPSATTWGKKDEH